MSLRTAVLLCSFLVCSAALSSPARAQRRAGNPLIAQGSSLYDELRFEEALQTLSAALVRAGNSRDQQKTIFRLLAFTYFALDRPEEAEGAYRSLLSLDPEFAPGSDVAPRVREFFAHVKERWEGEGRPGYAAAPAAPVAIRHRSPPQAEVHTPVTLRATVDDPDGRTAHLVLAYRQGSGAVFRRSNARADAQGFAATIPAEAVRPPLVEYYLEAVDASGLPIAQRGDVAAPLRIAVPEPSSSVFTQWWFWTGAAVVVAGAVVIGVLLAGGGGQDDRGTLVVRVH